MKYFFFGSVRPDPSGERRISVGPDYRVDGGSKAEHEEARAIVEEFSKGVKMDGIHHAQEILREAVRKVHGS